MHKIISWSQLIKSKFFYLILDQQIDGYDLSWGNAT